MLEQLIGIVRRLCAESGVMTPATVIGGPIARPAHALRWAGEHARAALATLPRAGLDEPVARQGALALINFLAHPSPALVRAINAQPAWPHPSTRAWNEPATDAYTGLCCTVQDIWEHLVGPEAAQDATIAARALDASVGCALDFGAGAGHYTVVLAQHGWKVDALEADAVKRAFLVSRLQAAGLTCHVRLVEEPSRVYDLMLAINVLDHVRDPLTVLRGLIASLSDRARLLVLASFPEDGWHRGIDDSVLECGELLLRTLQLRDEHYPEVPSLQEWIRAVPTPRLQSARPRMRRQTHMRVMPSVARTVLLSSPLFFARACVLSEDGARLAADMDGVLDVDTLGRRHGLPVEDVRAFADILSDQHLAFWA